MAPRRKKKRAREPEGSLAAYRKIRSPMPPPEQVMRDRRRELDDERAREEIDDARPASGPEPSEPNDP